MTTLNPATRLSSPELAVTRAGPGEHLAKPGDGMWREPVVLVHADRDDIA